MRLCQFHTLFQYQVDIYYTIQKPQKMNMVNYLRGKIAKIEVDSPSKKCKNITASQQIYLDQINNYIEAGGGYDVLKQKLFNDINENYMHESPLVQEIVIMLRKGLETQEKEKQKRCIHVIEEIIQNCGRVMNQAFHDDKFCEVLFNNALYLRKLKSADRDQIRQRLCGIFLYWHIKFNTQPHYIFHKYYQKLKTNNGQFPKFPYIKQKKSKKQQQQNLKQQIQNIDQIIEDCQIIANDTQIFLKSDKSKIDTNYVRVLKAKNKKIYALSTAGGNFTSEQKDKLGKVYKKIRNQLKEIDKMNQMVVKEEAIEKEKEFLQEKMEGISPKKSQKQIPKIAIEASPVKQHQAELKHNSAKKSQHSSNKESQNIIDFDDAFSLPQPIVASPTKISSYKEPVNILDLDPDNVVLPSIISPKKSSSERQAFTYDRDLLDIQVDIKNPQTPQKKTETQQHPEIQNSTQKISKPIDVLSQLQMQTPPKSNKKEYNALIDLDNEQEHEQEHGNFSSPPSSEKRLNFKQLYSANQLSPELKDLDLIGSNQKIASKQSLKSNEDEGEEKQFTDFV